MPRYTCLTVMEWVYVAGASPTLSELHLPVPIVGIPSLVSPVHLLEEQAAWCR